MLSNPSLLVAAGLSVVVGLSGCTTLPRSGPDDRAIQNQAAIRAGDKNRKVGMSYVLLDLTASMLPYFEKGRVSSLKAGFGVGRAGAPATILGVGDVVQISVFESSTGGLFIPVDAGSRPGNFVTLPQQTVDQSGTISVPYAGRIRAAGRSSEEVQREIERLLADRAIEPQALVSVLDNQSNQVAVLGDVNLPAKLPLSASGERVLDVIARAGGLSTPGVETYVTLQRRGREGTVRFSDLIADSSENILVSAGDTVYVNRERRTYLVFGAAGLNGRIDFEESNLTLAEALAKAGGLLDARADPAQVFVYRMMDRKALGAMKIDVSRYPGERVPVVVRANLRDPGTFFAVQQMAMVDKDILYISNADSTELQKFLSIVTDVTGAGAVASGDVVNARNAARALRD